MVDDMENERVIAKAKECFDAAEAEAVLNSKLPHVQAGLELLDQLLEQHPNASDKDTEQIWKIRRDFTQRLLVQFLSTQGFQQITFIDYFELFMLRLQEEMSYITTMEPFLKAEYESHLRIWFDILRAHLENGR